MRPARDAPLASLEVWFGDDDVAAILFDDSLHRGVFVSGHYYELVWRCDGPLILSEREFDGASA